MFTVGLVNAIHEKRRAIAVWNNGQTAMRAMQRATAKLNGQTITYRNDGRRVSRAFSDVGMSSHAHVSRNIKSAKLKRYVAPKWKPTPVRTAHCLAPYFTVSGILKYRKREIGTGAYDPRVTPAMFERVAERREIGTGVVHTRIMRLGGRIVSLPVEGVKA